MKENPNTNKSLIFKLQKPIVFAIFFSMILLFVYSLIFMTPFYDFYITDAVFSKSNATTYGVWSTDFADAAYAYRSGKLVGYNLSYFVNFCKQNQTTGVGGELQGFNHFLFNFGLIGIILTAIGFLFHSQKREVFYISNYITLGAAGLFGCGTAGYGIYQLISWSNYCKNNVAYNIINAYYSYQNGLGVDAIKEYFSYNTFSWVFILGFVVFGIIVLLSLGAIIYCIFRFIYQKKNPSMDLSEVVIDE